MPLTQMISVRTKQAVFSYMLLQYIYIYMSGIVNALILIYAIYFCMMSISSGTFSYRNNFHPLIMSFNMF